MCVLCMNVRLMLTGQALTVSLLSSATNSASLFSFSN